ncbi:MAG: family 78 glycoside hydrolase catalytic domain [Armatimonadaceae bacterium]
MASFALRVLLLTFGWMVLCSTSVLADLIPTRLRCEYRVDPMPIDSPAPRLFWIVESREKNQKQTAYRILAASSKDRLSRNTGDLWDTGKVASDETIQIPYNGKPLTSGQEVFWKVKVWDQNGKESPWSKPARWQMGLLQPSDWKAQWIRYPAETTEISPLLPDGASWIWHTADGANPLAGKRWFRAVVPLPADVAFRSARLLLAVDDKFTAFVNGKEVGRGTSWQSYQVLDIRSALRIGTNVISVVAENESASPAGLLGVLEIETSARKFVVRTGEDGWESAESETAMYQPVRGIGAYGVQPWGKIGGSDRNEMLPVPHFRKAFPVAKPIWRATVYATALGLYEVSINGEPISNDALAPGWTDYNRRVPYLAYDVTDRLKAGKNVIGALLGDGWYVGYLGLVGRRRNYGGVPLLRIQLNIEYTDGTTETIGTDGTWQTALGDLRHADLLMGCATDFRAALPGWNTTAYDPARYPQKWKQAQVASVRNITVDAHPNGAVAPQQTLKAIKRTSPRPGVYIYDFGQNFVGWAKFTVRGGSGDTITVRHGEFLNPDGTLYTTNLRGARQVDTYTLAGNQPAVCEPKFTFHGFQYLEIIGVQNPPNPRDVVGVVLHSDLPKAGKFTSSNPLLDRLAQNGDWGQRGNYLDIPTDCPQRDERLGWMGDAQVFAKAAAYNRDIAAFLTKWLQDVEDAQLPDGRMSDVSPRLNDGGGNAGWEDAGVICVYRMYEMYGDTRIIKRHWEALTRFMKHLTRKSPDFLRDAGAFGDWLLLEGPQHSRIHGTAYTYFDALLMAKMARAIGKEAEAIAYQELANLTREQFQKAFLRREGKIEDSGKTSQTFYALALAWDMVPPNEQPRSAQHFADLIGKSGGHLTTGFLGTPVALQALQRTGRADLASRILLDETYPGWLYPVKLGATTMWERWDGWTPDKGFQDPGMNSFNHYWLGCVNEYLYASVCGISPADPGFRTIIIDPETARTLTHARAEYDSIRGRIVSAWKKERNGGLTLTVEIPANTTATVHLPAESNVTITLNGKPARPTRNEPGRAVFVMGSGRYMFTVR